MKWYISICLPWGITVQSDFLILQTRLPLSCNMISSPMNVNHFEWWAALLLWEGFYSLLLFWCEEKSRFVIVERKLRFQMKSFTFSDDLPSPNSLSSMSILSVPGVSLEQLIRPCNIFLLLEVRSRVHLWWQNFLMECPYPSIFEDFDSLNSLHVLASINSISGFKRCISKNLQNFSKTT